jgi:phage replication initiation protein
MSAIIDWCRITFELDRSIPDLIQDLSMLTGLMATGKEAKGLHNFAHGCQIFAFHQFQLVPLIRISWGGEQQKGRAEIDIPGASCGLINWRAFRTWAECLPGSRITRVDVAVDFHDGQYTVDQAVEWHGEGLFNVGGRNPKTSTVGDWLQRIEGRTLMIGKRENGKQLRVYEKGKQLGNLESNWNRFEVQFGNRDREIPWDILEHPNRYFVGAYPALQNIIDEVGERIRTTRDTSDITLGRILNAVKRTYGKWLHHFVYNGVEVADLVESVSVTALPTKVQASAVVADSYSDTVQLGFLKWKDLNHVNL